MTAEAFGRYKVTGTLGVGGMGEVYEAIDEVLGRPVAVKTLRGKHGGLAARLLDERFKQEARAIAALAHPGVVQVFDIDLTAEPPYIVMERVAGPSLKERLAKGVLGASELRALGVQVGRALAAAHEAGIVHRDVKPANILSATGGAWKLADFGVAHVPDSAITMTGQFVGSPAYAAPEALVRGETGVAGDVYGLGATLYEAAAGRWPRSDATSGALFGPVPPLRELVPALPHELAAAIDRAVAVEPSHRPSASELADALAGASSDPGVTLGHHTVVGSPAGPVVGISKPPWKWIAIGAAAVLAIGIIAAIARGGFRHRLASSRCGRRETARAGRAPRDDACSGDHRSPRREGLEQGRRQALQGRARRGGEETFGVRAQVGRERRDQEPPRSTPATVSARHARTRLDWGVMEPGTRVGAYRVIAPLGRGGMGGVFEVEDDHGRRLALKSTLQDNAGGEITRRFAREANALRMLDHPNLIAALDMFVEAGQLYLVMEKVDGRTLTKRIADKEDPITPRTALVLARQILDGVDHAHQRGFVHRDLKPDNVLLQPMSGWERVKLIDFGIVKLLGDAAAAFGAGALTRTGLVFGTPAYMAPEQALGRLVDARADVYAVGIMLYEMLVGRVPFRDPDPVVVMRQQVKLEPPSLRKITNDAPWCTPEITVLVDGALAKQPEHRFADARAMIAALDLAFESLP